MAKFLDFNSSQYKEIPKEDLPNNCFFVCQTVDYLDPFMDWDYAVARMIDGRAKVLGKFKELVSARLFAGAC